MVHPLIRSVIKRSGPRSLIILALLLLALGSMAQTLADIIRGPDLSLLLTVILLSLLLGWGLAAIKTMPGWLAGALIMVLGLELMIIRVGQLSPILVNLGQIVLLWGQQWWGWFWFEQPIPGGLALQQPLLALWLALNTLLLRLITWGGGVFNGKSDFDPVAAALVWGLMLWLVSAWAGWATRRLVRPLTALAPAAMLLAITLAYRPRSDPSALLVILAAILLLLVVAGHRHREHRWRANGLDFAPSIQLDLAMMSIPIVIVLLGVAAFLPSISVRQITQFSYRLFFKQANQTLPVVSSLGLNPGTNSNNALLKVQTPGLPRHHLLGSGPELSEQIRMIVNTNQPPPGFVSEGLALPAARYYWRSLTYDTYTGRGWSSSRTADVSYQAGEALSVAPQLTQHPLQQQIHMLDNRDGLLHTAGTLINSDQAYTINQRDAHDIFAVTFETAKLNQPITYQAEALISLANAQQLRTAGDNYPAWVRERYLKLSSTPPDRVQTLARDLTATATTPYDRAKAIETYLRHYPYSLDLPTPPPDRDMVDYFLFDLQQGYCDYYATSMVVLARSAGLPARIAVGYATGDYQRTQDHYVVTEADAHSWVEVYFPDYGWIEFEPTAALPVNHRNSPAPVVDIDITTLQPTATNTPLLKSGGFTLLTGLLVIMILISLSGVAWLFYDRWRLQHLAPVIAIAVLYQRLYAAGLRLTVPTEAGATPHEFSASFSHYLETLAQDKQRSKRLSPDVQDIQHLTALYVQSTYQEQNPNGDTQQQAIQTWRRLRWRLWLLRLLHRKSVSAKD